MNSGGYTGLYVAKLLHDVNKYKPGQADFSIPSIMNDSGDIIQSQTIRNDTSGLVNKDKTSIGIGTSTVTKSIKIAIPIETVYFYPTKVVPKGTVFFVMFVGGDINKPVIVRRDISGYITSNTNTNG